MFQDVEKFISTCGLCQKSKSNQPTVEFDQRPTATLTPWTHISIDTLGPLPKDSDGFTYIIVVVDRFSRYLELFATKDCTARSAAKALLEVFSRYGPPQSVRSDQGTQFTSKVVTEFLHLLDIQHEMTIPYHPAANGLVERQNAEILKHLRAIVHSRDVKLNWSTYLPLVARTINNAWHSAINNAPARLVLGQLASLQQKLHGEKEVVMDLEPNEFLKEFVKVQTFIIQKSAEHQEKILLKLSEKYSKENVTSFEPGDYVLWKPPNKNDKLSLVWKGPFKVIGTNEKQLSSLIISDILTNKERTVHVSTVKLFKYQDDGKLVQAANIDKQVLDRVEKIVEHQIDEPTGIVMFKVRWSGYDEDHDTWEFWDTVSDLEAIDRYFSEHPEAKALVGASRKKR